MKKVCINTVLLSVLILSSVACATPNAWLSTSYTSYSPYYYNSWYRSPVTDGYMDILLFVDNVIFTNLEFSVTYDANTVQQISAGNVHYVMTGLTVDSAITQNLEGNWKKTTISLSGNVTIGTVQYESEAVCIVRFIPVAEGTVPVGLWQSQWTRYPQSYQSCSLSLTNDGNTVDFERKEYNDEITLFTFTDKTDAAIIYEYDYNFGNPITNGFLRVVYADESVQDFNTSNPGLGLTIATPYGGYFITPQPDAVSYTLMFPEYYDHGPLSLGGYSISHTQPSGFLAIEEGFNESIPASPNDLTLTVFQEGIGQDFASHQYGAAIAGDITGILNKNFTISQIDNNSVLLTIPGGLDVDYYNLYIYKDGLIVGRVWFNAAVFYDVTFTIENQNNDALPGAKVLIPKFGHGMGGPSNVELIADANGQAAIELPGNSEWGAFYQFFVAHPGYENIQSSLQIYDTSVEVPVVMSPAAGVDFLGFASFADWWAYPYCQWDGYCGGFDFNFDGTVDFKDLNILAERWLKD